MTSSTVNTPLEVLKVSSGNSTNSPINQFQQGILILPEDVKLAKSIKGKLFRRSGVITSQKRRRKRRKNKKNLMMTTLQKPSTENIPSQPLITDTEVQEILNYEEEENNSAIAVEVSEEVTDMQAVVIAPPESSPTPAVQQGTPSLNRLAIAAAQSSLMNQCVLQTRIWHGTTRKKQRMETSQGESGMGDMLEIMKMDMMSQMQQRHDQQESKREWQEDEQIHREKEHSRREEERSRHDEDSQFMQMMMMAMMGNMRQPSPNTNANANTDNRNDQKERQKTKNKND